MAPLYKTATALCLVGLFGLQSVAAGATKYKFKVVEVKDDVYLPIRLARNGKITAKTKDVAKDTQLVTELQDEVEGTGEATEATCAELIESTFKKIFHQTFDYTDTPDYPKLVEEALKTGLNAIGTTYPAQTPTWQDIWKKKEALSVLHLLGADSTKVGCTIAKCIKSPEVDLLTEPESETPAKAVLLCELSPAAKENEAAFSEEYFKEISTRTTDLKSMTEEDLKDPIVTSSANAAVPTILTACLVAILAAISA
ncbi:uncharacterized protein EMH_0047430 [Eimeria mitis]|uniref:SAG family member n=1 Tax=Eimeria mitis TaxID=44415 RepID=U6JUM6_9EIME|nr:uncharacterized protein EMH_0047430 [Eimeria mitis]CDJ29170.1 hypothetical protein EMH_0047430 [Eimeria mitis]